MHSFPCVTYPYGWEPPRFHFGMEVVDHMDNGQVKVIIGLEYFFVRPGEEPPRTRREGWWYWFKEDSETSCGSHESNLERYCPPVAQQLQLV